MRDGMRDHFLQALRVKANPRNQPSKPSPYSDMRAGSESSINSQQARKILNKTGTIGGFIALVMDIQNVTLVEIASRTSIHPGRLSDIMNDLADPTLNERLQIATGLEVSTEELP